MVIGHGVKICYMWHDCITDHYYYHHLEVVKNHVTDLDKRKVSPGKLPSVRPRIQFPYISLEGRGQGEERVKRGEGARERESEERVGTREGESEERGGARERESEERGRDQGRRRE